MSNQISSITLKVRYQPISALRPNEHNPRTHTKEQVEKIAASITKFGFTNPILIDSRNTVLAGHGRLEAAKQLGMDPVPTIRLEHMTKAQLRAYAIADNRLAELASWDRELLALEFNALSELDIDFDLNITGFESPEIDLLIQDLQDSTDPADEIPVIEPGAPPVTAPGDLWTLGSHCVFCGDATHEESYIRLMGDERAQIIFTDPPYNVPMKGHASGLGRLRTSGVSNGLRRADAAAVHGFPDVDFRVSRQMERPGLYPLCLHGLAPSTRTAHRCSADVPRTEKPVHLGQDQRRYGITVPVAA